MPDVAPSETMQSSTMSRVARGGTANLVGGIITALCTFALTVVIARNLPRADAGIFFSVTSLFLVATTVGQLGTQTGLVYFISRARALGRPDRIDNFLRSAMGPMLTSAVVMAVATLVLARPIAGLVAPDHVDTATTYLRILACFVPLAGIEAAMLSGVRGFGSMRANNTISQTGRPVLQLALVAAAVSTDSVTALAIAWSVVYLPSAVAAVFAWRKVRAKYPRGRSSESTMREFWRFSLPRALTSVIQMLMQRFDIVLVGALSGAVDAAIYAAATRFIVLGQLGTSALTNAAQPQLAHHLAKQDHHAANELYRVSTAWLVLVTWPIYLSLILFAEPLLRVFGSGYAAGDTVMLLLSLSMLLSTGLGLVDTVLSMAGRTSWNLGNSFLALVVNIGLDFWLIPDHGILGAAIGWAVAIAVRNLAAVTQVAASLRFHPFAAATAAATGATVICYLLVAGVARLALGATVPGLFVGLIAGTVCYLASLWVFRSPLQLAALSSLPGLRRIRGRQGARRLGT